MNPLEPALLSDKPYHKKIEQIIEELGTNLNDGLSEKEAKIRLYKAGPNVLPIKKKFSLLKIFLKQFKDFMVLMLLAVSMVAFLIQNVKDAIVILIVVAINTLLGVIQEYKAEKTIAALKRSASQKAKIIREGKYKMIPTSQIVPGDILMIEEGDIIQADGRIYEVANLATQESFLTGESLPIEKQTRPLREKTINIADRINMIFRGSTVSRGHGKVIVTATGGKTEIGKIAHLISEIQDKPTPLEIKLAALGKNLAMLTLILCLLIATIGILRGLPTLMMIQIAIVLGISCIPEGLVAVVTIALALGVQRMARKNAIIRRLPAVEALGSVTLICSDKTGTLTEGKMMAQAIHVNDQNIRVTGSITAPVGHFIKNDIELKEYPEELKLLLFIATLCNNATLQKKDHDWEIFGDATEGALLILGAKAGYYKEALSEKYPCLKEAPFDSKRKCMSKIYQKNPSQHSIMTKGAPEYILKLSTQEQIEGQFHPLSEEKKQELLKKVNEFAGNGYRLLAVAYRDLTPEETQKEAIEAEKNLIFLGFVAISDPIREETPLSIQKCHEAGIRTMILTGDHQHTASYIGKQLGIIKSDREIGNSQRLEALSQDDFEKSLRGYKVLSRISPLIKLKIVEALKKQGEIVAMTGDGVNDAPAITRANVGIAMGKTGTDVAKEAADIVLTDDNFSTIVSAIEEGRTIYDNILKFIRYLLACNIGEIFIMFFATLFALPLPFLPIQILWLNLVTDTPPALALGVDPPERDIMKRPPRNPKEMIFSPQMVNAILLNGLIMALITLGVFVYELYVMKHDITKVRTIAFSTLVIVQLLHAFNSQHHRRSIFSTGVLTNFYLVFSVLFSFSLLVGSIYHPFLRNAFKLELLTPMDWIHAGLPAMIIILAVEVQKKISTLNILRKEKQAPEMKKSQNNP